MAENLLVFPSTPSTVPIRIDGELHSILAFENVKNIIYNPYLKATLSWYAMTSVRQLGQLQSVETDEEILSKTYTYWAEELLFYMPPVHSCVDGCNWLHNIQLLSATLRTRQGLLLEHFT